MLWCEDNSGLESAAYFHSWERDLPIMKAWSVFYGSTEGACILRERQGSLWIQTVPKESVSLFKPQFYFFNGLVHEAHIMYYCMHQVPLFRLCQFDQLPFIFQRMFRLLLLSCLVLKHEIVINPFYCSPYYFVVCLNSTYFGSQPYVALIYWHHVCCFPCMWSDYAWQEFLLVWFV